MSSNVPRIESSGTTRRGGHAGGRRPGKEEDIKMELGSYFRAVLSSSFTQQANGLQKKRERGGVKGKQKYQGLSFRKVAFQDQKRMGNASKQRAQKKEKKKGERRG